MERGREGGMERGEEGWRGGGRGGGGGGMKGGQEWGRNDSINLHPQQWRRGGQLTDFLHLWAQEHEGQWEGNEG